MQKSELKLVFYLLQDKHQDKHNVAKSFRQIAEETEMSLGSIQAKMQELTDKGYIAPSDKGRVLRKRSQLIDWWALGYAESFKEKQLLMRFGFLTPAIRMAWKEVILPHGTQWSGEPAANIIDGYISPERWEVYVEENANALIATGRMIPNPQGEIYVYRKFWKGDEIPTLVIYADLLATGDDRCKEAAERIKLLI